jgi:hypothetical protein
MNPLRVCEGLLLPSKGRGYLYFRAHILKGVWVWSPTRHNVTVTHYARAALNSSIELASKGTSLGLQPFPFETGFKRFYPFLFSFDLTWGKRLVNKWFKRF